MEMSVGQNQLSSPPSQMSSTKNLYSNSVKDCLNSVLMMQIQTEDVKRRKGEIYERCRLRTPEVRRGHYCGGEEGGRGGRR